LKRVLVITNNLNQASFRLRMEAIVEPLCRRSIALEVKVRPRGILARRALLRSADRYDAVILQRKLLDPSDARLLARRAKRVFFDVDDAVMYSNGPAGLVSRWRTWRRFVATARNVDQVVAGNQYLADLFRQQGANASVLPTVVDMDHYAAKTHSLVDCPTLVWIGSRSTLTYVEEFMPAIAAGGAVKLLVVADAAPRNSLVPLEHIPWSAATEAAALCRGDIGIAPTPSNQWTQGKCGFKIVQYMAAGLPVIASPVGANAELVIEGVTGFLPPRPEDWTKAISTLATSVELRQRMGAAGRERAQNEFSLQRAVDFWAKLLEDA
jgi:glycosyltransferase involved in cell wall biosynthesis